MATDQNEIANLALSRLGITAFVTDFTTDNTAQAKAIDRIYTLVLEKVLEAVRPQFAIRRATLTEDTASTHADVEWAHKYSLPSNVITIIRLENGLGHKARRAERHEWTLEHDGTKQVLMANVTDAVLVYVHRETTTTLYPPYFTDALAWALAAELTRSLKVEPAFKGEAQRMALISLQVARAEAQSQGEPGEDPLPPWIKAR